MIEGCHEGTVSCEIAVCLDDDGDFLRSADVAYANALPFGSTALPGARLSSKFGIYAANYDYEGTDA